MNEFWQMGGYGAYVWSAYAIAGLFFLGMVVSTLRQQRRLLGKVKRFIRLSGGERAQ